MIAFATNPPDQPDYRLISPYFIKCHTIRNS